MAFYSFRFYPDSEEFSHNVPLSDVKGAAGKAIQKISKKRPDLYLKIKSFFAELEKTEDFDVFISTGYIGRLGHGLWEMRIPPTSNSGVFRIYFCESINSRKQLIILDAEYKTQKEPKKISSALTKMKEYREKSKQGEWK